MENDRKKNGSRCEYSCRAGCMSIKDASSNTLLRTDACWNLQLVLHQRNKVVLKCFAMAREHTSLDVLLIILYNYKYLEIIAACVCVTILRYELYK